MNDVAVAVKDRGLQRELVDCIRDAGYGVVEVSSIPHLMQRLHGGLSAVVVDASEPEDLASIASIRSREPGVRIVAIGDGMQHRDGIRCRLHGADDFVRMPFDVEMLERALEGGAAARGASRAMPPFLTAEPHVQRLLDRIARAAETDATMVIRGESGTGKTMLARWIHGRSPRALGPLVTVSCTGLTGSSALDVFTAHTHTPGDVRGGTLVLDELGDLAPEVQGPLLDLLLRRTGGRPGDVGNEGSDCRVIATTPKDPSELVREGRLRADLRLRLGVIEFEIPPLRQRPRDVELLAGVMAERFARLHATEPPRLGPSLMRELRERPLKGNVREIQSLMQRAAILFAGRDVDPEALFSARPPAPPIAGMPPTLNLKQLEREAIVQALARNGGHRTRTSSELGISVRTLRNKIRDYGLA